MSLSPSTALPSGSRLLVVSPHLDDAVLSCGWLLARNPGSFVLTVFAGPPTDAFQSTPWDRACGFASAAEAIHKRRLEDATALKLLGAQPCWLDLVDGQYGEPRDVSQLESLIECELRRYAALPAVIPMGLHHPDHHDVAEALLSIFQRGVGTACLIYEDVPYRALGDTLSRRLSALAALRVPMQRCHSLEGCVALKRSAAMAYSSQWARLCADPVIDIEDSYLPERYRELRFC